MRTSIREPDLTGRLAYQSGPSGCFPTAHGDPATLKPPTIGQATIRQASFTQAATNRAAGEVK